MIIMFVLTDVKQLKDGFHYVKINSNYSDDVTEIGEKIRDSVYWLNKLFTYDYVDRSCSLVDDNRIKIMAIRYDGHDSIHEKIGFLEFTVLTKNGKTYPIHFADCCLDKILNNEFILFNEKPMKNFAEILSASLSNDNYNFDLQPVQSFLSENSFIAPRLSYIVIRKLNKDYCMFTSFSNCKIHEQMIVCSKNYDKEHQSVDLFKHLYLISTKDNPIKGEIETVYDNMEQQYFDENKENLNNINSILFQKLFIENDYFVKFNN